MRRHNVFIGALRRPDWWPLFNVSAPADHVFWWKGNSSFSPAPECFSRLPADKLRFVCWMRDDEAAARQLRLSASISAKGIVHFFLFLSLPLSPAPFRCIAPPADSLPPVDAHFPSERFSCQSWISVFPSNGCAGRLIHLVTWSQLAGPRSWPSMAGWRIRNGGGVKLQLLFNFKGSDINTSSKFKEKWGTQIAFFSF